ncbi:MAG: hemerythrin domain-containing protein [Armatimonadetes bacterium]|nr:hemerythrin domain-containing protein [Armatimonadota bacterium]
MRLTEALCGEHGVFYAQLAHLDAVVDGYDLGQVQAAVGVLAAALAGHAGLEDELLFARLEPVLGTGPGPLYVMRHEHDQVEGALTTVADATVVEAARAAVHALAQVAPSHFGKEEQVLFPMAQGIVGDAGLLAAGDEWAARRAVVVVAPDQVIAPCHVAGG